MKRGIINDGKAKRGLTGIETAIILIAFVIVAAAFAFAVLNVGFQSTQKAQEVIKGGMEQAASAMELDGAVIAKATSDRSALASIRFTVKLSPGKNPIDFNPNSLIVAFSTVDYYKSNIYTTGPCDEANPPSTDPCVIINALQDKDGNLFLEGGDKFEVVIVMPQGTSPAVIVGTNTQFTIELKPVIGNVLTVVRTTPLVLSDTMFLG